jgi:hypothetical protein
MGLESAGRPKSDSYHVVAVRRLLTATLASAFLMVILFLLDRARGDDSTGLRAAKRQCV